MTALPSPSEMAATAFKTGKAGVMHTTALEMLKQHPYSDAATPALQLADRLHARGSVGNALEIVGKVGFTLYGMDPKPLTPEIMQGMIRVFNRGAAHNHRRTLSAAGMFILSGGHAKFPALTAPVTQTLMEKAAHFLEKGDYAHAMIVAATAKAGNYKTNPAGVNELLRDISEKAYAAGDYESSASAASHMADPQASKADRAETVRQLGHRGLPQRRNGMTTGGAKMT